MNRMLWDQIDLQRGISSVVIFDELPVPVGGVTGIELDGDPDTNFKGYYDGVPYRKRAHVNRLTGVLHVVTLPLIFHTESGPVSESPMARNKRFNMCYMEGSDKLHILYQISFDSVYGSHETINADNDRLQEYELEFSVGGLRQDKTNYSHVLLDFTETPTALKEQILDVVFGTPGNLARLPNPDKLLSMFEPHAIFVVVDHGDGTWTATGPDEYFTFGPNSYFEISTPTAHLFGTDKYTLSSY